jgi:gluconate 2-dehydrogenase subunit 3-like protein
MSQQDHRLEENQRRDDGDRRDQIALTRRQMIVASAGALAASSVLADDGVAAIVQAAAGGPKFFTKDEFAMVDELTELIIPTDEHSPGARAAACAAYIDFRLAEAFEDEPRTLWREGLKAIDTASQSLNGHRFLESSEAERIAVLTRIAAAEREPKTPEEKFFVELKARTVHAYYTSEIGIHKEMEYKGNTMLQEYVGTDVSKPDVAKP